MEEENRSRRKNKISSKKLLLVAVFALLAIGFTRTSMFDIKTINVTEMERYTKDEILDMANIHEGDNVFYFSAGSAEKNLEKDMHFENVKISRALPDALNIEIKERIVRGYVPYMGSYLYIDEYGRVLEVASSYTKPLPVMTGLNFDSFTIGEQIDANNTDAFNVMVVLAQAMTKYELLDMVVKIDVSDVKKITAYVNNVKVNLGDISNSDQKIRTMAEVIKKIPQGDKGTLDLSDLTKPIIFKYLT